MNKIEAFFASEAVAESSALAPMSRLVMPALCIMTTNQLRANVNAIFNETTHDRLNGGSVDVTSKLLSVDQARNASCSALLALWNG